MMRKVLVAGWLLLCCMGCCQIHDPPVQPVVTPPPSPFPLLAEVHLEERNPFLYVSDLDWKPASDWIAIGGYGTVYLYSLADKELREIEIEDSSDPSPDLVWSDDGLRLAGTSQVLWVWDSETDKVKYNVNKLDTYSFYHQPHWSPDGQLLLSTLSHFNTRTSSLELWSFTTGEIEPLVVPGVANPILADWSPDGRYAAIITYEHPDLGPTQIYELSSEKMVHTFPGGEVRPVAWDSSGTKCASVAASGEITVWDTSNWQPIVTLPGRQEFTYSIEWRPQGDYLAIAGHNGVTLWNVNSGPLTLAPNQTVFDVAWDTTGRRLAFPIRNAVFVWDVAQLP